MQAEPDIQTIFRTFRNAPETQQGLTFQISIIHSRIVCQVTQKIFDIFVVLSLDQRQESHPDFVTEKFPLPVGLIAAEGNPFLFKVGKNFFFGDIQQRTNQTHALHMPLDQNPPHPLQACAAQDTHQDGFRQVVPGVSQNDGRGLRFRRKASKKLNSSQPGQLFQRTTLFLSLPNLHAARQGQIFGKLLNKFLVTPGCFPEAVVEMRDTKLKAQLMLKPNKSM